MDNRIEIKVETDDEVEPYDGTCACLFCSDSVWGKPALKCWQWNSNPFHRACDKHSRYAEVGRTCGRRTVEVWKGASAGTAAPSAIIDLTGAGDGAAEVARLTERGAREDAVPAVSGAVAAPDGVGQGARGGRADAESGGSGKGKEPAQAEAGPDAEAGGAATRGRAGAVGGGGTVKGHMDNGSAKARIGGESSGGGSGRGQSGRSSGTHGSRAADQQGGEGSRKRAAADGDEGGSSEEAKQARGGKPGQCEHNRQRSRCRECGGGSICQHNRQKHRWCRDCGGEGICQHNRRKSECKECGGRSICQHNRRRSRCTTCKADNDDSMPPDLEEL